MKTKTKLSLRITAVLLMICMMAGLALSAFAVTYPKPSDNIYDGTSALSNSVIETIKSTNDTLYEKVGAKISICIVDSLGEEKIEDYARNIFSEWKLGDGVLIIISKGDNSYYAVQSVGVENVLTNKELATIVNEFLEPDFVDGNIDKAILKTVNKLSSFLKTELPGADEQKSQTDKKDDDKDSKDDKKDEKKDGEDEKKVTFVSVILSILKIILWTVIIIIAAFVIFFIVALFNDDAAELMQKYIFNRGRNNSYARQNYYDERIYGRPNGNGNGGNQQNRQNQRRLPPPNQQRQQYDRYRQGGVRYNDEYYGQPQQNQQYRRQGQGQQRLQNPQGQQNGRANRQYSNSDGYTQQYNFSGARQSGSNRNSQGRNNNSNNYNNY